MRAITDEPNMISSPSSSSPSPSGPSLIIFYQHHEDVHGIPGVYFEGTHDQRLSLLRAFDARAIHILLVHISFCTGWRTQLTRSDCLILFAGGPYEPDCVCQALARVRTPIPDRHVSLEPPHST